MVRNPGEKCGVSKETVRLICVAVIEDSVADTGMLKSSVCPVAKFAPSICSDRNAISASA